MPIMLYGKYDQSTKHTGCACLFLDNDFDTVGVDVVVGSPTAPDVNGLRGLVPGPPATALCCSASCSPGSNGVGSADRLPL